MTTTSQQAANRERSRTWYHTNREEYNAKRRERYASSKDVRKRARERAAEYRQSGGEISRQLTRELHGRNFKVYSTGQIAKEMNRTPQMLRNWVSAGLIPPSIFPDKHKLYTAKQKRMIIALGDTISQSGGSWSAPAVKKAVDRMYKRW